MYRYFFHTQDGVYAPDEIGTELASLDEARAAAVQHLCDMVRGTPKTLDHTGEIRVTAADAEGLVLFTLSLSYTPAPAVGRRAPPG